MTEEYEAAPSAPVDQVTMAGTPIPPFGQILRAVGPWMTSAILAAVTSGAICAFLLNRSYGGAVEDAPSIGWMSAMAVIGAHPAVIGVMAVTLLGGIALASFGERLTRAPAVGALLVVGVSLIPWGLGITGDQVAQFGGFGIIDPLQSQLAAANLLDDWWLLGLWFGLTWMAGRHNLGVFVAAVWIVSLYATWQLNEARGNTWEMAVRQVLNVLPSQLRTGETLTSFEQATHLMYTRAAADLFYFLTPMLAIGMLRRRLLSTMAVERARSGNQDRR